LQGEHTTALKVYLNPQKSRVDRDILARLLADNAHGNASSAVIRKALAEHYGLEDCHPAPAHSGALEQLTAEVEALRQTVAGLTAFMERHHAAQAQEIARLQVALMALAYGDRTMQRSARAMVASLVGNDSRDRSV
jgi:hypothetical protein